MKTLPIRHWLLNLCALLLVSGAVQANDFPTADRVLYVQECMRAHPGSQFEMTNKCACALDTLAADISYDDYVTMSTISKATTMAGERGGAIRDAPSLAPLVKRYRELQAKAEKACFLNSSAK
jgi:hypothetical protein